MTSSIMASKTSAACGFTECQTVTLHGLASEEGQKLNGLVGTLVKFDEIIEMWHVVVNDSLKMVRPQNVAPLREDINIDGILSLKPCVHAVSDVKYYDAVATLTLSPGHMQSIPPPGAEQFEGGEYEHIRFIDEQNGGHIVPVRRYTISRKRYEALVAVPHWDEFVSESWMLADL